LKAGARVAVVAREESPQLQETRRRADEAGGEVLVCMGDLRRPEDSARIARQVEGDFGHVDLLVNNAGVPNVGAGVPFWERSVDEWMRMVHTNVDGAFFLTRELAPGMIARGGGRIVNISTGDRTMVRKGFAPYGPSKAFLEAASRIFAQDLAGTGVTVNVLLPGGAVDTAADLTGVATTGKAFLPVEVMNAPLLWLASRLSDGHNGERFVASLWDERLPLAERIATARQSGAEVPLIM
jgi:3-oxoacyl-[acyl-carrier protein] reductase